ncbi:MAG: hypothetical protein JSS02_23290 [Planctomycetes bacterium]|nr:hypothetical protein [Planctomycetota bacterium]
MHACLYVIIPAQRTHAAAFLAVDSVLQPFDEALPVLPYRVYLDFQEVCMMAKHYQTTPADLYGLTRHMTDWTKCPGGVDRKGLYYLTTRNPDGRWDFYEIGGRWNRYMPGSRNNVIRAQTLANSPHLADSLPMCLLTPAGEWLESEHIFLSWDWKEFHHEKLAPETWYANVREQLLQYPDHQVVCVDIHF